MIDAIDPVGTLDRRVYDRIGQVFGIQEKYDKYFTGNMVEDIGLYYSIKSRYNTLGDKHENKLSSIGASKTFIESHIPFGVTGNYHDINGYKALILPMLTDFESKDFDRIEEYVRNGGNVYMSGATSAELLKRRIGAQLVEFCNTDNIYRNYNCLNLTAIICIESITSNCS